MLAAAQNWLIGIQQDAGRYIDLRQSFAVSRAAAMTPENAFDSHRPSGRHLVDEFSNIYWAVRAGRGELYGSLSHIYVYFCIFGFVDSALLLLLWRACSRLRVTVSMMGSAVRKRLECNYSIGEHFKLLKVLIKNYSELSAWLNWIGKFVN